MDRYAPAALTLIDGDLSIPIRPAVATAGDPIACQSWDLGAPDVRITSTPLAGADGTVESAGYFGARTVTLDLLIRGDGKRVTAGHDPYWYVEQLTAMCHPARTPQLKVVRNSESSAGVGWYLALRGNPWSLVYTRASAAMLTMTLSFTAPLGLFESDLRTVNSTNGNPADATDWHFYAAFPHNFGAASNNPFITATIGGSAPVNPILYISGPVTNPYLVDDTGQKFKFTGLSLLSGETVQINMGTGTVLKADPETNGTTAPAADIFNYVDFTVSTFWTWQPGTRKVAFHSNSGSFAVQWRDRKLTI